MRATVLIEGDSKAGEIKVTLCTSEGEETLITQTGYPEGTFQRFLQAKPNFALPIFFPVLINSAIQAEAAEDLDTYQKHMKDLYLMAEAFHDFEIDLIIDGELRTH